MNAIRGRQGTRTALLLFAFLFLASCCEAAQILKRHSTLPTAVAAALAAHLDTRPDWSIKLREPEQPPTLFDGDYVAQDDPSEEIDLYLDVDLESGRCEMLAWMGYPEDWDATLTRQRERMRVRYEALHSEVQGLPAWSALTEYVNRASTAEERRMQLLVFVSVLLGLPCLILLVVGIAYQADRRSRRSA